MLRLKQALDECGIQQKALSEITGFGKTQISLTLNTGKLPANRDKFVNGVFALVGQENGLSDWLILNNLDTVDLCQPVTGPAPTTTLATIDLERTLCEIAGRAVLAADGCNNLVLCLARAASHLHRTLTNLVGEDAPYLVRIEDEIADILKGARP